MAGYLATGLTVRIKPYAAVPRFLVGTRATITGFLDDLVLLDVAQPWTTFMSSGAGCPADALEPTPDCVPVTVHVKHDQYDYYIGRAMPHSGLPQSPFHNPFHVSSNNPRADAIRMYGQHIAREASLLALLPLLRGKRIACWCKTLDDPTQPCHGDVLSAILRSADDAAIRVVVEKIVRGQLDEWDVAKHCGVRVAERCE